MTTPTVRAPEPARIRQAISLDRAAANAAATGLLGAGALHAVWGLGSSWPMANRADLSDAVLGSPGLQRGGAAACFAVAGALGGGAALVAGWPQQLDPQRRAAMTLMAAVLAGRGVLGLTGRTALVSPVSTSARFRRLDRRIYAPVCLALAGLTGLSLARGRTRQDPRS